MLNAISVFIKISQIVPRSVFLLILSFARFSSLGHPLTSETSRDVANSCLLFSCGVSLPNELQSTRNYEFCVATPTSCFYHRVSERTVDLTRLNECPRLFMASHVTLEQLRTANFARHYSNQINGLRLTRGKPTTLAHVREEHRSVICY
jgi:hypothetical protein